MTTASREEGRVLAIDSGKVRVGLALSDETRTLASPLCVLDGNDRKRLIHRIAELCLEHDVKRVLVGLPLHMTGEVGASARKAADLAQQIADATGLDVELVDERWTTVEAQRKRASVSASRKKPRAANAIDAEAAAVMLQGWLDGKGPAN